MTERVVQFGDRRRLVGTLTPVAAGVAPTDVAFVFFNAGVIGRVGPHRINVKAARHVAGLGFAALRFDLSGLGDSRAASGVSAFERQAVSDLREAMNFLDAEVGARRFVLSGLCSGADNSYATALVDERVVGLLLLDPYAYPTWKTRLRLFASRFGKPAAFGAIMRKIARHGTALMRAWRRRPHGAADSPTLPGTFRQKPPKAEFEASLRKLTDRGASICLCYSGGMGREYNYVGQFADAFGAELASKIRVEYAPEVNHTRSDLSAHDALLDLISTWSRRWRS